jgi:NAD(P)H-nitrite reductase large subunit
MKPDDEVCLCFHVSKRKIVNFIRVERPKVVSQVAECGGAGTGCGWCRAYIGTLFTQSLDAGTLDAMASDDLSPADYAAQRSRYVRAGGGTPPPGATPID